jgi:ribosomal-protein-alanine N-acetyltransferase
MPDEQIVLETDRVYLRQWMPDDVDRFRPIATDPRVIQYIGDGQPWPQERIRRFVLGAIEAAKTRGWVLWPVIHKRDRCALIGICGFNGAFEPEIEIGWWLAPQYWGQGIATEIAAATMAYGFEHFDFPRLICIARPENRASIRVMEKLGMTFERAFAHQGMEVVCYARDNPGAADQLTSDH